MHRRLPEIRCWWGRTSQGAISASPIVAGDTMYVASHDGVLYAVR
ncbi:hypothetical protein C2W62_10150 [Candidatus Entotheonella serta]|nr:hypothetical protein C2W62_10150 [Candidatus Entotheonella serta]